MSKFIQEDLTRALEAFQAAKAEVMSFAIAWHGQLEEGSLPTSEQVADFQAQSAQLNNIFKQACDHYYEVRASVQLP